MCKIESKHPEMPRLRGGRQQRERKHVEYWDLVTCESVEERVRVNGLWTGAVAVVVCDSWGEQTSTHPRKATDHRPKKQYYPSPPW